MDSWVYGAVECLQEPEGMQTRPRELGRRRRSTWYKDMAASRRLEVVNCRQLARTAAGLAFARLRDGPRLSCVRFAGDECKALVAGLAFMWHV